VIVAAVDLRAISGTIRPRWPIDRLKPPLAVKLTEGSLKRMMREQGSHALYISPKDQSMFVSFFPRPLPFALSAILWEALAVGIWYTCGPQLGTLLGFQFQASAEKQVGVAVFWSGPFLCFYLYLAISVALFAPAWMILCPHLWSIVGSALILFTSYFQVQVSVAINSWYGPLYDLI